MILTDESLAARSADTAEFGGFVRVDDVADAIVRALAVDLHGHHRLTLCGPGSYDTALAETTLGWRAVRGWPAGD